ncbi:DUF222 domain-containing protein [Arthrobacter sp. APC 3897]|uniref:HNH endonuclease signature motif containing protein n=1 Tax=Arthrobacter sp. APC 3897 TaxID=3035204 RepID=UPI0025B50D30|nr:HNH endonuclease signature motif containing protein [Arthrobacter sp. APC 3897]MDN3480352.1 DUF222 domain-containing protein [Arthrobacter sp. APC 3897]
MSVFTAGPATAARGTENIHPGASNRDGFTGSLAVQGVQFLTQDEAGAVLSRLDSLTRWAQAQQAKVLHRMEILFRDDLLQEVGREDPALTFSLAAEEAAAILHVPTNTAKMLMSDAGRLCTTHTASLGRLEEGVLGYGQVQTVLDQSLNVPAAELAGFEADLLELAAAGQTVSQFRVKARRLREGRYPETIPVRHKSAFEARRVCLAPDEDGMSWLSALLPAARAQLIFTQLSTAARGEQGAGDRRGVDQLRADILTDLLEGDRDEDASGNGDSRNEGSGTENNGDEDGGIEGSCNEGSRAGGTAAGRKNKAHARARARAEILVLITAETLFGADEQPAELHGYGPITAETARRLAREAARWTPVERHPDTHEVLRVGRRRKVPPGLQRWLRARDGTCRFPGCRTNAVISEIDHTTPWSRGGATDHDNLEYLCRRHHMFKSRGFWKARQRVPGIIEWTSPGGLTYRTDPHLTLAAAGTTTRPATGPTMRLDTGSCREPDKDAAKPALIPMSGWIPADELPDDGDDPPPF